MKFIFNIAGILLLLASGCARAPAASVPSVEGSDAERVVALLDYVSGDYALNAKDGVPASRDEYEEQLRFAGDARRLADRLLGPGAEREPLGRQMAEVESRIRAQAPPEVVAEACRAAREEAIIRFGLRTTPPERPSLARAQALYAEPCAICHGPRGPPTPPRALAYARQEPAFGEALAGIGLDRTRRMIRQARQAFSEGRAEDADRIAIDAYLQGYEPLEARLRARDPQATAAVEGAFRDLRAAISRGDAVAVQGHAHQLDRLLADGPAPGRPPVPFPAPFVFSLRARVETGVLLAGLSFLAVYREAAETVLFTQALLLECPGQRGHVWAGAAAGVLAVMAVALVMSRTVMRLPMGPFFAVSSALLCGLAISFAGAGIYDLVAAGYLSPRPVTFPEIPWMGIHPDLTGLMVQLTIVAVILGAALTTLRRRPAEVAKDRSS